MDAKSPSTPDTGESSAKTPESRIRKLPKSAWKPGQSGNPKGRPRTGQSWGEVIKQMTEMAPDDIARMVGGRETDLGRAFLQMPRKVQLKYLIIARTIAALMFDPSKGMLDTLMDRMEGKVSQTVDLNADGTIKVIIEYGNDDASSDDNGNAA